MKTLFNENNINKTLKRWIKVIFNNFCHKYQYALYITIRNNQKQQKHWKRSRHDDDDESFLSNNITSFLGHIGYKSVVNCKSYILPLFFHNLLLLYCKFSIPEELYYISTYTLCQVHHFPGFSEVSFTLLQRLRKSSKQQPVVLRTYVYTMYRFFLKVVYKKCIERR